MQPPPGNGTPGVDYPPLGSDWTQETGGDWCVSIESQLEADLCAGRLGEEANSVNWPVTTVDPATGLPVTTDREKFPNQQQSCTVECADGSPFTFTVIAGKFLAETQDIANAEAYSFACRQAEIALVCLLDVLPAGCTSSSYFGTVTAAGMRQSYVLDITAGAVPPGIVVSHTVGEQSSGLVFQGTPTVSGSAVFTVRAEDNLGNFMTKQFTIVVIAIDTASVLPDVIPGGTYSEQLSSSGGTAPYAYVKTSGVFPPEVTMDESGLISGEVPVDADDATYFQTVMVTDSSNPALTCSKDFSIRVNSDCPDWETLVWTFQGIVLGDIVWLPGEGLPSSSFSFIATEQSGVPASGSIFGDMTYNGTGCVSRCSYTFSGNPPLTLANEALVRVRVWGGPTPVGLPIVDITRESSVNGNGPGSFDFMLPDTSGIAFFIRVQVYAIASASGQIITNVGQMTNP